MSLNYSPSSLEMAQFHIALFLRKTPQSDNGCYGNYSKRNQAVSIRRSLFDNKTVDLFTVRALAHIFRSFLQPRVHSIRTQCASSGGGVSASFAEALD